jgi:DNA modification methylase
MPKTINTKIEDVLLAGLKPHPRNANQGDFGAIQQSVEANGFYGTVVANKRTGHILAGNHRFAVAKQLGFERIPVAWVDVDDQEELRILIADNRTTRLGIDNEERLAELLSELAQTPEGLLGTGFDGDDLDDLIGRLAGESKELLGDPDEVPEPPADPITKPGDLWILGNHRLLCGDSTKAEDVARLMDGAKAGMMVTDPPYGVNYDPEIRDTAKSVGKITNDDRASWLDAWELFAGDVAYVWHASLFTSVVLADLEASGLRHVSMIIWKKPYATFSMANYHWQHEPCWYCVRPSGTRNWIGSPKESTVWDMTQPKDPYGRSGEDKTPHPTQKPVEAMARPMRNHDHAVVYDPFCGSGTTLIAAEQLGRRCYGMEISPQYCDVIVKRWEMLTGKKAVLEGQNGETD